MSRYAKVLHLEKPKRIVIWDGGIMKQNFAHLDPVVSLNISIKKR
jgi:hypothetical protein